MKNFSVQLGAALIMLFALTQGARAQCYPGGNCQFGDPGVECYLNGPPDCYPDPSCNAPGCPGVKCAWLYLCYQYDEPCGNETCTDCAACASGNCPPGTHVAMGLMPILAGLLPDSLRTLHEKAERAAGLHGFRGSKIVACRRPTTVKRLATHSWWKVVKV